MQTLHVSPAQICSRLFVRSHKKRAHSAQLQVEVYSLTRFLWTVPSWTVPGLSHSTTPCCLSCSKAARWDHSRNLWTADLQVVSLRHECIVMPWAQSTRYSETGIAILPQQGQSLQYLAPYEIMAHTCKHSVTTKHFIKNLEKLSRSTLMSLLTSQPRSSQAPTVKHWICTLTWHSCEYLGLDRSVTIWGAVAGRLCVCYHDPCYSCASVCTCTFISGTQLLLFYLCWQDYSKPVWVDMWRRKGYPTYNRSSQRNEVITIHLDMAQLP